MARLYDAHNHLQDERLAPYLEAIWPILETENVVRMVVNGSCEEDWPAVFELSLRFPKVIPAFGYHPWYVRERTDGWQDKLRSFLDRTAGAGIGEIGLDRWIEGYDLPQQEEVFIWQWRLAAERNLPVSIHCLKAWGRLLEILLQEPRTRRGFLLHSYGGPQEMVPLFAELGAYFSLSGYFAHERKSRQREAFLRVPADRLLIETDAPDMLPPPSRIRYALADSKSGEPINHPGSLSDTYMFAAELVQEPIEVLVERIEKNFLRLFGSEAPG